MNSPFFFSILTVLILCSRQNITREANNTLSDQDLTIAKGDTVKELGNNIMTVYQDRKHNYWFGSWEDGLYHYDGKTIFHFTTKDGLYQNTHYR